MPGKTQKLSRDPERTKRRILAAALHEFALHGFAGARVDTIARRAGTNKRMLYHYFTDKDGLFCAVLRHKIYERQPQRAGGGGGPGIRTGTVVRAELPRHGLGAAAGLGIPPAGPGQNHGRGGTAASCPERHHAASKAGRRRADLIKGVEPQFLQLALAALTMFPIAMPQMTRLITGRSPDDARFQRDYARYLETIARRFRP